MKINASEKLHIYLYKDDLGRRESRKIQLELGCLIHICAFILGQREY